jgi:hypothetical protein
MASVLWPTIYMATLRGMPLYHFLKSFIESKMEDEGCGSCGKRVLCVFRGAVDAFLASIAPAASTAHSAGRVLRWPNEIGGLAGSAWMPQRLSAAGGFAPRRGCPCGPSGGELRLERQYRGDGIARPVDE